HRALGCVCSCVLQWAVHASLPWPIRTRRSSRSDRRGARSGGWVKDPPDHHWPLPADSGPTGLGALSAAQALVSSRSARVIQARIASRSLSSAFETFSDV